MNVEIQANQCREDKVRFFPVLDFSVLLAVLVGRKKKKKVLFSDNSSFKHIFTTLPISYFSS